MTVVRTVDAKDLVSKDSVKQMWGVLMNCASKTSVGRFVIEKMMRSMDDVEEFTEESFSELITKNE
eukprot:CAMPEP_0117429010 /NCGR_PEP_ID=MMETSP0758-20121206/8590_1 /TAXON_ID=63605 /ORGANISM="Percolomonas cosmopolitus, Strain AE-1 (ATCC 50343)" /LENGTH=65 /DNA_ID=CAMNT_0005215683 /DNA_START=380 /DNA_END=577 /DNA_ORIENTATION=+